MFTGWLVRSIDLTRTGWPVLHFYLKLENNLKLVPSLEVHLGLTYISGSQLTVSWFKIT